MYRQCSLLVMLLLFGCDNVDFNSQWHSQLLNIDGDSRDWDGIHLEYIEDMSIVIGVINNDSALSMMYRFSNLSLARHIEVHGVIIWLNTTGEEEKLFGIRYRNQTMIAKAQDRRRRNPGDSHPGSTFSVVNGEEELPLSTAGLYGVDAARGLQNGLYVYEFRIQIQGNPYIKEPEDQTLHIGLEVPGIGEETRRQMEERSSGRGRPGGSGKRGRGRRAPGSGHMQTPYMNGQEVWMTVHLANSLKK